MYEVAKQIKKIRFWGLEHRLYENSAFCWNRNELCMFDIGNLINLSGGVYASANNLVKEDRMIYSLVVLK